MATKSTKTAKAKADPGTATEAADKGNSKTETPAASPAQGQDAAARQSAAEPAASKNAPEVSDAGKGASDTAAAPDMAKLTAALTSEGDKAAASKAAPTVPDEKPENLVIVVIGPKQGLWRAGRHFTSEPVCIPVGDLSDEHAAMLRDEPKLAISLVQAEVEPE